MVKLGFFHFVHDNLAATEFAIQSAREHYPDAYYVLIGDGGVDHYDLAKKYNCDYHYYNKNMGYGSMSLENTLRILRRVFVACAESDSTHLMMMEDDVVILDKIDIPKDTHCMCQPISVHNKIHPQLLKEFEDWSKVKPTTDFYGFGGGSILKVLDFYGDFDKIFTIFKVHFERWKTIYPQTGWIDCFLTFFYYLAGQQITINHSLYTVSPWPTDTRDFDLNIVRGHYSVVDRYKNNYK